MINVLHLIDNGLLLSVCEKILGLAFAHYPYMIEGLNGVPLKSLISKIWAPQIAIGKSLVVVVHSDLLQLHFLSLFKSLHVQIPGYVAKSLVIHHQPIMPHTPSGRCVRWGEGVYVHCLLAKLSGQLTIH